MVYRILVTLVLCGGFWVMYGVVKSWFCVCFTIELDGMILRGWNLLGKEFLVDLTEIVEVAKTKGLECLDFVSINGERLTITADMDYNGFIQDFILERLPPTAHVDREQISKFRQHLSYWKYTKQNPPSTRYGIEYIEWLEKIAEDQRQELVGKHILRDNAIYGFQQWKKLYPRLRERRKL